MDADQTTLHMLAGAAIPMDFPPSSLPLDHIRALFSILACGVVVHDPSGAVRFANEPAEHMLGRTIDRLRGRRFFELGLRAVDAQGAALPNLAHPDMVALHTGEAVRSVTIGIANPSGHRRWLQLDAVPIKDASGALAMLVTSFIDVTERKRAEDAARRSQAALREEAARLNAIVGMQRAVATLGTDLQTAISVIVRWAERLTHAAGAVVELREGEEMVCRAASDSAQAYLGLRLPLVSSLSGHCARTGQVLCCEDTETDPRAEAEACRRLGIRSLILVPLEHEHGIAGVLKVFQRTPGAFDERDVQSLLVTADVLSAAIGRALAFEANRALIQERTAALEALRESEHRLRSMVELAPIGACIVDEGGAFELVNDAYCSLLGLSLAQVMPEDRRRGIPHGGAPAGAERAASLGEYDAVARGGRQITVIASSVSFTGADGRSHRASFVLDITEQKRIEHYLTHVAHHDALTGLPNRVLFHDRLTQALLSAERHRTPVAVLLIDLDRFKAVNDSLGHAAGDRLLQGLATRLHGCLRASDTVARMGGDEFAVLLPHTDAAGAIEVARKLHEQLCTPLPLDDVPVEVGASIGIAIKDEPGVDGALMLHRSDVAMYAAKRSEAGCLVYREDLESQLHV